ncbi:26533_t:CDS:2 [Gigaspora margarita]|uniref:26533_t:CDS:1 n=1 Tax=Gigaspora margarita TaxID=4874 RepID=A0ABN7UTR8_GIGMA|nr:26533_t:CDS:2 [Gigaspora margarita]
MPRPHTSLQQVTTPALNTDVSISHKRARNISLIITIANNPTETNSQLIAIQTSTTPDTTNNTSLLDSSVPMDTNEHFYE